jgi:hypothetical protein
MNTMKKTAAGAVLGGALLAAGGLGLAHAAPPSSPSPAQSVVGDGKVNVTVTADGQEVGVIRDVSLTSAEALATSACANAEVTADALKALDTNGTPVPGTCAGASGGLTFTFAQNEPGNSEGAPGQNKPASSNSSASSPTTTSAAR